MEFLIMLVAAVVLLEAADFILPDPLPGEREKER